MLIIWGTKVNQHPRGVVADKCAVCEEVRRFHVTDHYRVGHIYFIPLGGGTLEATSRVCQSCGTEFVCDPEAYDNFLPAEEADPLSLDELVRQTNSPLARNRDARKRLEKLADQEDRARPASLGTNVKTPGTTLSDRSTDSDGQLRRAIARLQPYENRGAEVAGFLDELHKWRELDDVWREALLRKIDVFIENQQKIDRAVTFLRTAAHSFPTYSGCLIGTVLLAALGSAYYWLPVTWNWWTGIGYAVVALLIVFVVFFIVGQRGRRRWFRDQIIPQAEDGGVDLQILLGVLMGVDRSDKLIDEKIRDMAGEVELFAQVLIETGKVKLNPPAPAED